MTHITQDELIEIAWKVSENIEFSENESESLQHLKECPMCERQAAFYLDALEFFKPQNLENFYFNSIQSRQIISKTAAQEKEQKKKTLLYEIKFVLDQLQNKINCYLEKAASGYPVFQLEESLAFARGEGSTILELAAEQSVIRYDPEAGRLAVSLDEDLFGTVSLVAVLLSSRGEIRKRFEPDGYGMTEAVFEECFEQEITLVIQEEVFDGR